MLISELMGRAWVKSGDANQSTISPFMMLNAYNDTNRIVRKIILDAGPCEKCGKPFEIKMGRFGRFLACTGYPDCKNIKKIPKKQEK